MFPDLLGSTRLYGVMVSTLDFESNNPSSILGRASLFFSISVKKLDILIFREAREIIV